MKSNVNNHCLDKRLTKHHSLLFAFSIPFVLQLIVIVGLMAYLSHKNGQETISDLADRLLTEIGLRIDQDLKGYLQNLEQITQSNLYLIKRGALNPSDPDALKARYLEQMQSSILVNSISIVTEERDFMALERDDTSLIWRKYDKVSKRFSSYRLDGYGNIIYKIGDIENFDPHNDPPHDPWYSAAKKEKKAVWILVVSLANGLEKPELHMVNFLPYFDEHNQMIGLAAASIYLSHFNQFLTTLKVGDHGQSFVIDRQGRLIATSSGEMPFKQQKDASYADAMVLEKRRLLASESGNPLTAASARALIERFTSFESINESRHFIFNWNGSRYFLKIEPIHRGNLDWLTVITVPESDFMRHITQNTRYNFFLAIVALTIAIGVGVLTTRWITRPIHRLNRAAKEIAKGRWEEPIPIERSDEIGELAATFREMALKLKVSFERLQEEIVERKQMGETLKVSEARFRRLLQNITAIAVQGYRLDGVTTYWNEASERFYGYTSEEAIGKSLLELIIPPEMKKEVEESMVTMARTGKPIPSAELSLKRKDGSRIAVFSNHALVQLTGSPPELFCLDIDLTDKKEAEAEIFHEREKLKILSDNAPFGMVLIDRSGRFTYINSRFTTLFGFRLSDIPDGKTWFQKAYPDKEHRRNVISTWIEDVKEGRPGEQKTRVFTITCKDGAQKVVQFILSVLFSGESLMTCEDITTMRKLESQLRQAQKMEAIGTLAGGISHDFNNILTAIIGYASLLKMKIDQTSLLQSYVDQILSASQKAAELTKGLLTFSRQKPVTFVPIDINHTIQVTEKLLKRVLTEDIELVTLLTHEDAVVMSDNSQMDQIYFNLVANARDAMPRGGKLTIETRIVELDARFITLHGFGKPGVYVLIRFSDTGIGMDEETREKIFDPFFTTKAMGKGTGLGLATVYGIVKQHNGYIVLESEQNSGATFLIYLPRVKMDAVLEREEVKPVAMGHEKILVAEDNPDVMQLMREALQQYGYSVIEARDGEAAVEIYNKEPDIDLVILDSVMPKKNGREVFEEMRRMNPSLRVLFISGYTKDVILEKGFEDKIFDFITKPLSLGALLQKIREILNRPRNMGPVSVSHDDSNEGMKG